MVLVTPRDLAPGRGQHLEKPPGVLDVASPNHRLPHENLDYRSLFFIIWK